MSCPLEWYPGTVADFLEQALKSSALDPCQKEGALDKDKMTQKAEEFVNKATEGMILVDESQADVKVSEAKAT